MARGVSRVLKKMVGGAVGSAVSKCPPGFYCMDMTTMLAIVAVIGLVVFVLREFGLFTPRESKRDRERERPAPYVEKEEPKVIVIQKENSGNVQPPNVVINPDPRFSPMAPEQSYGRMPDLQGFPTRPMPAGVNAIPINTQTRGYPDQFQQIGLLTTPGGTDNSATPTRTILPLFGRSIDTSRNRWNYYTRTDGMNPVQVPVQYKRRNCDDDTGCDELMDGESVGVPVMGQSFTASIYRYSTPRYIPVV